MSKISIDLIWKLENGVMDPGKYSNQHEITFTPNTKIKADSAPDWRGNELNTNPEQTLAGFKVPKKVEFCELPKTSTGKIQKFELRKKAKDLN